MNKCFAVLLKPTSLKIISEEPDLLFEPKNLQTPVNLGKAQGKTTEMNFSHFMLPCLLITYLNGVQHGKNKSFLHLHLTGI